MTSQHSGTRLGPKIAALVSRSIVATHTALLSTKHKLAMAVFHTISDEVSIEAQHVLGPTLKKLLDDPNLHPDVRPHVEFLAYQHGQLSAIAGANLAASSILASLALPINVALAPAVRAIVQKSPTLAPDPGTISELVAKDIYTKQDVEGSVTGQGFSAAWFGAMIDAAKAYPDIGTAIDMYRRGLITAEDFILCAQRNGTPQQFIGPLLGTSVTPLSPADAALATLRGNMSEPAAAKAARMWGVSQDDFGILIGNMGEPLGLEQLAEALRRGFIDTATFARGIRQSRVRNEWIPVAEKLRFSPMSVADAVNAVVQNHMSSAEAASIAEQNGLEPGMVAILEETAGEPLSRTEMETLYNRGLVTEAEVIQASRESRLKNKYNTLAFQLRRRLLEPRMLATAVEDGAVTHEYAIKVAMEHGFNATDAAILVNGGSLRKLKTYRDRVVAAVEAMYADNAISQQTAESIVSKVGYSQSEAAFIFQAAEFHRSAKLVTSVISVIRTKYLNRHINQAEASNSLDALGVPSSRRDELLSIWGIEHNAFTRVLTEAQIVKAVKLKLITEQEGNDRLVVMGYNQVDAALLLGGA